MFPTLDKKLSKLAKKSCVFKHRKRCFDCGKPTQPHCPSAAYVCCYCFYYWVDSGVWYKVADKIHDDKWNGMLCLHCFAKRLGRTMRPSDFSQGQSGFFDPEQGSVRKYIKLLVEYANSGENTSLFL